MSRILGAAEKVPVQRLLVVLEVELTTPFRPSEIADLVTPVVHAAGQALVRVGRVSLREVLRG